MRLWMVDPRFMCRKHLLGEHVECHMFVGSILKGTSMNGYLADGFLEIESLRSRHEELAAELVRRNYNHASPLPDFSVERFSVHQLTIRIDRRKSLALLHDRCLGCATNYNVGDVDGVIERSRRRHNKGLG